MSTQVKFGYLLDFRQPPQLSRLGSAEFYSAMFQQVEYADQAGLDSIWVTEHHFTEDGYLAAVMPAMAAIAARTKRVTIGSYVLLVPFYHPLRLAEDTALIDVMSQGRLRLGLGLGYREEEFAGLQIARKERLGRTLETIDILKRAWTGEPFGFSGKYFNFRDVQVLPRPISQPHPELLWAAWRQRQSGAAQNSACPSPVTWERTKSSNIIRHCASTAKIRPPLTSSPVASSTSPTVKHRRGRRSRRRCCIR
jgi:alkanesulfonate monooxygenase SsuD/methylene tetrahydromethanopterin reductase-like flavin-dependent oxidoreductase (luciferase family)